MKEEYKDYLSMLYDRIPAYVYEGGLSIFIIGSLLFIVIAGFKKGWRKVVNLLLIEYVFLIYCSTVIFRDTNDVVKYRPISIKDYKKILEGHIYYIDPEMAMNVLVFVPLGLLLCAAFKSMKWWQALSIGGGISVSIEILQFVLKRGTTEAGDVLHNTLGCLIGIGLYYLVHGIWCKARGVFVKRNG